jgi:hypothetical protein
VRRIRRMKTLLAILVAALATALSSAPAALADGPPQVAQQFGTGVAAHGTRYVAVPAGRMRTMVLTEGRGHWLGGGLTYRGSWGIPQINYGHSAGISRRGDLLFLQSTGVGAPTSFLVLSTKTLQKVDSFTLDGDFSFDALSPDASRLYLIQRVDEMNYARYVVRAYDRQTHRLLPGRVADRTQKSWVMSGLPLTRTTTPDGRWVYTLYTNPGGYPFIHALDTVRGVAHCVGLPWTNPNQDGLWNLVLAARRGALDVHWKSGRPQYVVDTATWRVSLAHRGSFAWWWPALGAGLLAGALAMELGRRRRRNTRVTVEGGSDVAPVRPRPRPGPRPRARGARRGAVVHRVAGR